MNNMKSKLQQLIRPKSKYLRNPPKMKKGMCSKRLLSSEDDNKEINEK